MLQLYKNVVDKIYALHSCLAQYHQYNKGKMLCAFSLSFVFTRIQKVMNTEQAIASSRVQTPPEFFNSPF